jgi:MerR family transcriptional regulator/heat shock protein HspR
MPTTPSTPTGRTGPTGPSPAPGFPQAPGPEAAVYVISVAAELTGLHPQTLRTYERLGLITPGRTVGGGRRYSLRDIELLRSIAELTSAGIGIEGVRRILDLQNHASALRARNAELQAELEATREALRQALTARRAEPAANRLPVLRTPAGDASLVVWRRSR